MPTSEKERYMSRLVVITGASAGVGRAAAVEFARRGDRVALLARGEVGLAGAAAQVRALGAQVSTVPTDVADPDQVAAAVERIEREMGPIDVWVNAAFSSVFARFEDITPAEFKRATEVTYLGYVYSTMAVLPRMRQRNRGTIVHIGSALAYRGIPLQTAYCGAKHAIQGFHEALRCELLHERSRVRVTMVQLPALNTPQFAWGLSRLPERAQPVPPIFQPEVAARAIAYAVEHPRRREYWVGASTVATLMANAVAPGAARPVPEPNRVLVAANRPGPTRPPAGQPVGACGRVAGAGLRCARGLRRAGPLTQSAAVAGAPLPPAGRHRRCPGSRGPGPLVTHPAWVSCLT